MLNRVYAAYFAIREHVYVSNLVAVDTGSACLAIWVRIRNATLKFDRSTISNNLPMSLKALKATPIRKLDVLMLLSTQTDTNLISLAYPGTVAN
jgi:hypothetical protein